MVGVNGQSRSLRDIAAKNNVSLYMEALQRHTEAPFNKLPQLRRSDRVSKALKFEPDLI